MTVNKTTDRMGGLSEENHLGKTEEEEKWREEANSRERWGQITKVEREMPSLAPTKEKQEEDQVNAPSSH